MPKTKSFSLLPIIFFTTILSVLVVWGIRGNNPQDVSIMEGRVLGRFSTAGMDLRRAAGRLYRGNPQAALDALQNLITTRSDQKLIEAAASDQFPLRLPIIKTAKSIDRLLIKLVYLPLPDPAIPADMFSSIYVLRDESALIPGPEVFNDDTRAIIDANINNYQVLITAHPELNFFAYQIDRLQYSPNDPLTPYFPEADKGQSLAYFEQNKPEELSFRKMNLGSYDAFAYNFYAADHHWNIHGVIMAYNGIYDMLKENLDTISPRLEFGPFITFPGVEFLGHPARASFYPIKGDVFEVVDVDLPPHKILSNGEEISYNLSENYLEGRYSTEPYFYHYSEYFGGNYAYLEYVFENGSDRNLLFIGDSYKIPLQPLVASHYNHTYFINLPLYGGLSLSTFLSQHQVDDILVVGGNNVLFLDKNWAVAP